MSGKIHEWEDNGGNDESDNYKTDGCEPIRTNSKNHYEGELPIKNDDILPPLDDLFNDILTTSKSNTKGGISFFIPTPPPSLDEQKAVQVINL